MFSANSSQVSDDKLFVEDVMSCFLYTGTGSAQTITNGIDLAGKGGLVWVKNRGNNGTQSHCLVDTARGATNVISSNNTNAQSSFTGCVSNFLSSGFVMDGTSAGYNASGNNYASWTFRKAPKFFDVVTYTGNGTFVRQINHSLGVTPGFIVVKRTDSTGNWMCIHRNNPMGELVLNSSAANTGNTDNIEVWTSTYIGVSNAANVNGATYVAYLFAHDTTSDGIIQCGSFSQTGSSTATVNLGWEPQWVLVKNSSAVGDWTIVDSMRGNTAGDLGTEAGLYPNSSAAENTSTAGWANPTATGFTNARADAGTYIYIAIRRGPMRTPTSGTSVFSPIARSGTGAATNITSNINQDVVWQNWRSGGLGSADHFAYDRLRGFQKSLFLNLTSAESTQIVGISALNNTGYSIAGAGSMNNASGTYVDYAFTRAPSFMDVVCYTGTGSARTVNHNLGVAPELIIIKSRSHATEWIVGTQFGDTNFKYLNLNTTASSASGENYPFDFSSKPTATSFGLTSESRVNGSGRTFVSYLFASCPGVSKVGNYTGNGSSQTINCGFAAGARFVMIKRTDSTGDWYVWDTARGIVSGNDPHLSLNTTAAEVTTDDSVDTDSSGFVVNQLSATNINVSSAQYIYLAVA